MTHQPAPGYYQPQPQPPRGGSGLAIGALIAGVLALVSFWTVFGGILLGVVAIVLGLVALSRVRKGLAGGRGMAIAGIVTGALGLVLGIAWAAFLSNLLNSDSVQNLQDCLQEAGNDEAAQSQCERDFDDELQN